MTDAIAAAAKQTPLEELHENLKDLSALKEDFHAFVLSQPVPLARKLAGDFDKAMTETFHLIHEDHNTSGIQCTCHEDGDADETRGLGETATYSLQDYLLNINFDQLAAGEQTTTAGLGGATDQYRENQREFERQEQLLQQFQQSLTLSAAPLPTAI